MDEPYSWPAEWLVDEPLPTLEEGGNLLEPKLDVKTIGVHEGRFHSDDIISVAILKILCPQATVVRTRDPEELAKCDIRVDVGGIYSHETKDYDHHMEEDQIPRYDDFLFMGKTVPGPKYSGAGLIWKHYGIDAIAEVAKTLSEPACSDVVIGYGKDIHWDIAKQLIIPIDIQDNGQQDQYFSTEPSLFRPIMLTTALQQFLAPLNWECTQKHGFKYGGYHRAFNEAFDVAVDMAKKLLTRAIAKQLEVYCQLTEFDLYIEEQMNKGMPPDILVLSEPVPWSYLLYLYRKKASWEEKRYVNGIKIVITPTPNSRADAYGYLIQSASYWKNGQKLLKAPLPERLRGKVASELVELAKLETITFVHPSGFIGGCDDIGDALELAEMALKENDLYESYAEELATMKEVDVAA